MLVPLAQFAPDQTLSGYCVLCGSYVVLDVAHVEYDPCPDCHDASVFDVVTLLLTGILDTTEEHDTVQLDPADLDRMPELLKALVTSTEAAAQLRAEAIVEGIDEDEDEDL
jgi:hypothetical protein